MRAHVASLASSPLALLLACAATTTGSSADPTPAEPVPERVPAPEPEPIPAAEIQPEPGGLGVDQLAFVALGSLGDGPFVERGEKRGHPALLVALWDAEEVPSRIAAAAERAFGPAESRGELDGAGQGSVIVEGPATAAAELAPPAGTLWLISPCGPVRAEPDRPVLSWYDYGLQTVELSWLLRVDAPPDGCADPGEWSQIAVFAETLPAELRYVPALQGFVGRIDAEPGPYPALTQAIVAEARAAGEAPDEVWLREREIPDTSFVEVLVALVTRDRGSDGDPPDPCADAQFNTYVHGDRRDGGVVATPLTHEYGPADGLELRGAFVLADRVVWTVHEDRGQAYVHDPRASPSLTEIVVAHFHDEDFGEGSFDQTEYCGP